MNVKDNLCRIDLHMHTTVSDGTDTPEEILRRVREAGISLFSVTDHDDIKGGSIIRSLRSESDPRFITGVEFSCRDEHGRYHILGYNYDPGAGPVRQVVKTGHDFRVNKVRARVDFLKTEFGFEFPPDELDALFALDNPGKPHIGNLMVKYGYASTKEQAIKDFINRYHAGKSEYVRPGQAIQGILGGGGIPVLAHPCYGSGDQLILGEEMDERLKRLIDMGLAGMECFYSGFTDKLRGQMLAFAERYGLYVTAGSDYHGSNKMVALGDTGLDGVSGYPDGLRRFLQAVGV